MDRTVICWFVEHLVVLDSRMKDKTKTITN